MRSDTEEEDKEIGVIIAPVTKDNIDILTKIALLNMGPCDKCGNPIPNTSCYVCHTKICEDCTNPNSEAPFLTCKTCELSK